MISGILYYFHHDVKYLILGIVVAQIDPLSVASILRNPKMSIRVKSILAAWSSFDDPITVLLSLYFSIIFIPSSKDHILNNHLYFSEYIISLGKI